MLLIFAFSITPKNFLHNCTASHKNSSQKSPASDQQQVAKSSISCTCDNFVAGSPFTEAGIVFQLSSLEFFSRKQETKPVHFFSSPHFFFSLRGPPVV